VGRMTGAVPIKIVLTAILFFAALLGGCTSVKMKAEAWQDSRLDFTWPQPPEKSRIKLLKVIRGAQDVVEISSGTLGRFFDFVVGSSENYVDFFTPQCIAANGDGLIYIADPSIGLIHVYNLASREVAYITHAGDKKLIRPVGVALDSKGALYVTDSQLGAVFKLNQDGSFAAELDGKGKLEGPAGIAVNSTGVKIVADLKANKIFLFDKNDVFLKELPGPDFDGAMRVPVYVSVDANDNIYVTDTMNFTIRVFDSSGKYLRNIGRVGDSPGSFARPKGVAIDSDRHIYVMDSILANFQIFDQEGQLLLYVGQEGQLPGEMMLPSGIFIDKHDRIYVSDTFNNRIQIFQYLKEDKSK
jgi:streptogramin lyase